MDKKNILIVDDDHISIMALTHILRPEYTIYAEKNGQDALKTAVQILPDIILLDINMPVIDGYGVLKALKTDSKTSNIPVVFITGVIDSAGKEKGISLGAADYIEKPFDLIDVKRRVEKLISSS